MDRPGATRRTSLVPTFGNARRCLPTNSPNKRNGHVMSSGSSSLTSTAHNNSSTSHNRGGPRYSSSGCVARPSTAKQRPGARPVAGHLAGSSRPVASKRPHTASTIRTNTSSISTTTTTLKCSSSGTQGGHPGDGGDRAVRGGGVSTVARVWELKGLVDEMEGYKRRLAIAYRAAGTAHKHPQEEALVLCERVVQASRSALSTLTYLLPQQHSPTFLLPPPPPQSSSTMPHSRTIASPLQLVTQRLSFERNADSSRPTDVAAASTIASPRTGQPQGAHSSEAVVTHAMCAGEKEADDDHDHLPTEEELSMILETELQSPPPAAAAAAAAPSSNRPPLHRPLITDRSQTTSASNSASEAGSRRSGDDGVQHAGTAAGVACPHSPVRERSPCRDPETPPSMADLQLSFATRKFILASAKKATAAAAANHTDNSPASPVLPSHTHTNGALIDEMTNAVDGVSTPQGADGATLYSPVFRTGIKLRHPPTDARRTTMHSSSSSSCVSPPMFEPTIHSASAMKLVAAAGTCPPYAHTLTTTTLHNPHAPTPSCASFTSAAETPSLSALSLANNAAHITVRARDGGKHTMHSDDDSTPRFASPLKTRIHQLNSVEKALMTADRGGQPLTAETPDTGEMRRGPVALRFPGHANGSADRGSGSTPAVHRTSLDDSTLYPDITRHEMSFRYSLGAVDEEQPYKLDVGAETEGLVVVQAAVTTAAATAGGVAGASYVATPDGGHRAAGAYAPHGQQPIITATTPITYDDSFLDPLLESPLDASPVASATAGAAATATSPHVTTPPGHTATNAANAGSTPYSVVRRLAEAAGNSPQLHAVSIAHDHHSPGCTPLRRSARVRTPVKAYTPPEHTPRPRQPRYIHHHHQRQPQQAQQQREEPQHDSRAPLERPLQQACTPEHSNDEHYTHHHIEDDAGSHEQQQQQQQRRKSVRDRPPTPTPTRTRRSLLLDDVVGDDDASAEGGDGCGGGGGGAVRGGGEAGGGGDGKGGHDRTGQSRRDMGRGVGVRHAAADGGEEEDDEATGADRQHGAHTCAGRKGTPSSHKRRKPIRTTPSSASRRRTSIASPSTPTDTRTQTRTRRRSSSSVKRGRRGSSCVVRGAPVNDSPLPRKSPRLVRKQVGGLLGGEGPDGNGAAQRCIGCGEVEGGGVKSKGQWNPLCPITEEEYARAPTFIKIQVTRDMLNEAIGKINGHSHKVKRLRPLQQDEVPGVLCMGDAMNRTVLLSLIYMKRVEIVMANDGASKAYKTWK